MQLTDLMQEYFSQSSHDLTSQGTPQKSVSGWEIVDSPQRLMKDFKFASRTAALEFLRQLTLFEDSINHHAKITLENDSVRIEVYTHDIQAVTELDEEYAQVADQIHFDVEY